MTGRQEINIKFQFENLKERDLLENIGVEGRITPKVDLKGIGFKGVG
jgi:hypothetical protein